MQLPPDSKLRESVEAIHDSGKRAATVVADLLTVARGAAATREIHSINSLALDYLRSPECSQLKTLYPHVALRKQFAAEHPYIMCSSVHIKKCLMNLVTNAAEAIEDMGSVLVSTHNERIDEAAASGQDIPAGEYVVLIVQDSGPGISDEDLEHIFEPFYSKKVMGRSGTGLGLAVVWNTIQDHSGKIHVESSAEGTSFQLYLPVAKAIDVSPSESDTSGTPKGNGEHILIVDDELQLQDIAGKMLEALGYHVNSVGSGEQAVQFVRDNPVDLLLLDMFMEPGMSGRKTYEEILKLYPNQKAVLVSGFSEGLDVKATLKLGANEFIRKPYSMEQLGRAVKDALES